MKDAFGRQKDSLEYFQKSYDGPPVKRWIDPPFKVSPEEMGISSPKSCGDCSMEVYLIVFAESQDGSPVVSARMAHDITCPTWQRKKKRMNP